MALDKIIKVFVPHISSLVVEMKIYLAKKAHISSLFIEKVIILAKYLDYIHVFLKDLVKILLK